MQIYISKGKRCFYFAMENISHKHLWWNIRMAKNKAQQLAEKSKKKFKKNKYNKDK